MPVIDASVLVDALVAAGRPGQAARAELSRLTVLEVPGIFAAEAASALRALVRCDELSPVRAAGALDQIRALRTMQYPFEPFSARAWELRENVTIYDAWYVALAEWLGTELVTADERLTRASGPRCRIRYVQDSLPE
jgi:predicted nucleic acid-binding protein